MTLQAQYSNALAVITRPIYLIQLSLTGGAAELFSTAEDVSYKNEWYHGNGIGIQNLLPHKEVTLLLPFTTERMTAIQGSAWRTLSFCRIYNVAATTDAAVVTFVEDAATMILEGVVVKPSYSGQNFISLFIAHQTAVKKNTPRNTFNHVTTYAPPAGSLLVFAGDTMTIEAPR